MDPDYVPHSWSRPVVNAIVARAIWTPAFPQSGGQKAIVVVDSYDPDDRPCADYDKMFDALPNAVSYCVNIFTPADINATNAQRIRDAGAVFFPGGDQSDYIKAWGNTIIEDAIAFVFNKGGVLAGTSAGAMILSSLTHGSRNGTLYSEDAIGDPYCDAMDPVRDLLEGVLPQSFAETHFTERGRISRVLAYHGRAIKDWKYDPALFHSFGVQTRTALVINPKGIVEVFGEGHAGIFYADTSTYSSDLRPQTPIGMKGMKAVFLTSGFKFDLTKNRVVAIPKYAVKTGKPPASAVVGKKFTDSGSELAGLEKFGEFYLTNAMCCSDYCRYALENGRIIESPGSKLLGNVVLATDFWNDFLCGKDWCDESNGYESKFGGLLWLAMKHPHRTGLLTSRGNSVQAKKTGVLTVTRTGCFPVLILETYGATTVAQSQWHYADYPDPRQECAIVPMTVHSLNGAEGFRSYDLVRHAFPAKEDE